MKKASISAVCITTFFYLCCGGFGYAAFGNSTPGNLLTGFGFYEPYWLIDFANACIVLHLVGGYQVPAPLSVNNSVCHSRISCTTGICLESLHVEYQFILRVCFTCFIRFFTSMNVTSVRDKINS